MMLLVPGREQINRPIVFTMRAFENTVTLLKTFLYGGKTIYTYITGAEEAND